MKVFKIVIKLSLAFCIFHVSTAGKICKGNDHDPCRCELRNGSGIIDITELGRNVLNPPYYPWILDTPSAYGEDDGLFCYNPCFPFDISKELGLKLAVFFDPSGLNIHDIGQQASATFEKSEVGVQIRSSVVFLLCEENETSDFLHDKTEGNVYFFHLRGKGACPTPSSNSNPSFWGTGNIALVTCAVVIFIYLMIGITWKLTKGRQVDANTPQQDEERILEEEATNQTPILGRYDILDDHHPSANARRTNYGSFDETQDHEDDLFKKKCNSI